MLPIPVYGKFGSKLPRVNKKDVSGHIKHTQPVQLYYKVEDIGTLDYVKVRDELHALTCSIKECAEDLSTIVASTELKNKELTGIIKKMHKLSSLTKDKS